MQKQQGRAKHPIVSSCRMIWSVLYATGIVMVLS